MIDCRYLFNIKESAPNAFEELLKCKKRYIGGGGGFDMVTLFSIKIINICMVFK